MRTQHSSLSHAPLDRQSTGVLHESSDADDSVFNGGGAAWPGEVVHARSSLGDDTSDGEDEALAEAIKLSLMEAPST
jgi:hypothetical protein